MFDFPYTIDRRGRAANGFQWRVIGDDDMPLGLIRQTTDGWLVLIDGPPGHGYSTFASAVAAIVGSRSPRRNKRNSHRAKRTSRRNKRTSRKAR